MRRVLYITGTRADYGLMRSTLKAIDARDDLELIVVVTGMHLMQEFGGTASEVEKDGFRTILVPTKFESDSRSAAPRFLGAFIQQLTDVVDRERPDEILLLGDRAEMLAGAIVGSYIGIPTFHVHGGDVSSTVDEHVRHAITKLSHHHLAATPRSAERIKMMGEEPWRIHTVGSPSLDGIDKVGRVSTEELVTLGLGEHEKYLMLGQHPVSDEALLSAEQIGGTIDALIEDGRRTLVVYPNADAGGRRMIEVIEKRCKPPQFILFKNLPRDRYLRLLSGASALVGNSSSGLVEAPSLGVPFVNVGTRQKGRERGENVIDVGYGKKEVLRGLDEIKRPGALERTRRCRNPYGDGHTGERIARLLSEMDLSPRTTQKTLSYTFIDGS